MKLPLKMNLIFAYFLFPLIKRKHFQYYDNVILIGFSLESLSNMKYYHVTTIPKSDGRRKKSFWLDLKLSKLKTYHLNWCFHFLLLNTNFFDWYSTAQFLVLRIYSLMKEINSFCLSKSESCKYYFRKKIIRSCSDSGFDISVCSLTQILKYNLSSNRFVFKNSL